MPTFCAAARVNRAPAGGKDILPTLLTAGTGVLPCKHKRQIHLAKTFCQVLFVQDLDLFHMLSEWLGDGLWKHGDTILLPLAVAHQDLAVSKVDIFDTEADALHQA